MTLLNTTGQPSDATGSSGDYALDQTNRFLWGPKTTTWANTATSTVGPSGPPGLQGVGAPASSVGNVGQGYTDMASGLTYLKTSNGWGAAVGSIIGPQGAQGLAVLSGAAGGSGPLAFFSGTASGTPQTLTMPGSTVVSQFTPLMASAFLGGTAYNGSATAATIELYNLTNGQSIFSVSVAANTVAPMGLFAANTYPLAAQNNYVWRITGTAAANMTVYPQYLFPATSAASTAVSSLGPAGNVAARTWGTGVTTAANFLPVFGAADTSANTWYVKPNRVGFFYGFAATYIPAGATPNTAQVTLSLAAFKSGSQPTLGSWTLTANSQKVNFGPFISTTYPTDTTFQYYWVVTGTTGSGTVIVEPQYVY